MVLKAGRKMIFSNMNLNVETTLIGLLTWDGIQCSAVIMIGQKCYSLSLRPLRLSDTRQTYRQIQVLKLYIKVGEQKKSKDERRRRNQISKDAVNSKHESREHNKGW